MKFSGETHREPVATVVKPKDGFTGDNMSRKPQTPSQPRPNDQRANTLNPNNAAHKAAQDNRANQLNPNHPPTKRGR